MYLLQFDREAYNEALNSGAHIGDEGVEAAFDLINEVTETYVNVVNERVCRSWELIQVYALQRQDGQMDRRLFALHKRYQPSQLPDWGTGLHHQPL